MSNRNVVIAIKSLEQVEAWGSIREMCANHKDFSESYMYTLEFPIEYKGWTIHRVPFRQKS